MEHVESGLGLKEGTGEGSQRKDNNAGAIGEETRQSQMKDNNAGAIGEETIDTGAIGEGTIDAGAIGEETIDTGAIGEGTIDAGAIGEGTIDAGAIGEETIDADAALLTPVSCEANWRRPTSDGMGKVHKAKPKLRSARAMCFSSEESTQSRTEPETKDKLAAPWEAAESESRERLDPDQNRAAHVRGDKAEEEKRNRKGEREEGEPEKRDEEDGGGGPRRRIPHMSDKVKEAWKVRRSRLGGNMETDGGEGESVERERRKRWTRAGREQQGAELKEESETEADREQDGPGGAEVEPGPERFSEGGMERGSISRHAFLSHMIMHSSASSSSSSVNYSSAESDEVFSDKEETTTRRQKMRKSNSWKSFMAMMQWSVRRQSSWVQLAGHQGNFQPSEGGQVLKRYNAVENSCLQALMKDSLRQFVPRYHGLTTRGSESYIRLEDLLSGLTCPVIMDCKMGVRTYLEEELVRARSNPCVRTDMYQKMVKVDPAAPSAEEHAQGGVTKPRYMQWRDSMSSTSTLGFRIEGITVEDGRILRDFKKTRTSAQVTDALLSFTKRQSHILEAYLSRLQALNEAVKESEFFQSHEVIGSSLLFVHDRTNKANIWMIDFGKTTPTPSGVHLQHNIPWVEGNREDGYMIGLNTLTLLVKEALRKALGQYHDECNAPVCVHHQTGTQSRSQTSEIIHNPI